MTRRHRDDFLKCCITTLRSLISRVKKKAQPAIKASTHAVSAVVSIAAKNMRAVRDTSTDKATGKVMSKPADKLTGKTGSTTDKTADKTTGRTIKSTGQALNKTQNDSALRGNSSTAEQANSRADSTDSRSESVVSNGDCKQRVIMPQHYIALACVALVIIAFVVAVVLGVRSLTSSTADDTTSDTQSEQISDSDTDENSSDDTDTSDDADSESADDTDSEEYTALTEEERADILAEAQETAAASGKTQVQYTYCVTTQGDIGDIDLEEFENTVYSTLNDSQGWPRAGATFVLGDDSTCTMTLILAAADEMTSFSESCSAEYSCRVGENVIINVDRWNSGTDEWLSAGGTVERYRIMVINHEVGHFLGHYDNETTCGGDGEAAPLMMQQSMGTDGCVANEWPLDSELWINTTTTP